MEKLRLKNLNYSYKEKRVLFEKPDYLAKNLVFRSKNQIFLIESLGLFCEKAGFSNYSALGAPNQPREPK